MPLEQLQKQYSTCLKCPELCKNRSRVVFGEGNPNADIILIGEAPGTKEDNTGVPFCGMSGKILDELLEHVKLSREEIFITNTILCKPPKNRNPSKDEVANCSSRLDELIKIIKPKLIVTIGNFATKRIIKKTEIKTIHGQKFQYEGITVIPVIHPASYLYSGRNPGLMNQMKKDFREIAKFQTQDI